MAYARASDALFAVLAAACAVLVAAPQAAAQTAASQAGIYVEVEGQAVFGDSSFDVGLLPDSSFTIFDELTKDEGDGWGGALAIGYAWRNGWSAAVRYRWLDADDRGGPVDPGIVTFAPGVPVVPGGFPIGVFAAETKVSSETTILDFEVGNEFAVAGGRLQLFGGITYMSIERDIALLDDGCGCAPFAMLMANDFHGLGPKIGFRGGFPLTDTIRLVGGGSMAALFGTSKFMSHLDDPLFPALPFKDEDDRIVAALGADGGVAFGLGIGTITLGYRIDAVLGALDTDQRVSDIFKSVGFPAIGDRRDDFLEHGPFARVTLPLGAAGN